VFEDLVIHKIAKTSQSLLVSMRPQEDTGTVKNSSDGQGIACNTVHL